MMILAKVVSIMASCSGMFIYLLWDGVVIAFCRRDCGVAFATFCFFLGVVGTTSSASLSFVSTYCLFVSHVVHRKSMK